MVKRAKVPKGWVRNRADERAVDDGCAFDLGAAAWAVWWIEHYCRLYEGEHAGEEVWLRGCHRCDEPLPRLAHDHGGVDAQVERLKRHARCVSLGHASDWQLDVVARMFGWLTWSDHFERRVRRFRDVSVWVPKKNKKSPTLAAIALYLLAGEGESGQKVFLAAKDGNQARDIAGGHAIAMVEQSDELSAVCDINRNLARITHWPSRSYSQPLSSGSKRTQQAKQGLNGSVIVDETHVVDREFVAQIDRAGISRANAVFATFSTAGNNPDSYGRERWDYGVQVNAGEIVDASHLFVHYGAPQKLTNEQLHGQLHKLCQEANPAWGHTIRADEIEADYVKSRQRNLAALADFKMYRLNIWQQASHPWLDVHAWDELELDTDPGDRWPAVCALDLGQKRDFSSLATVWRTSETTYHAAARHWMTEAELQRLTPRIPNLRDWIAAGWIDMHEGDALDYEQIQTDVAAQLDAVKARELIFDPTYAFQMAQNLARRKLELIEFGQSMAQFAGPTADLERLLAAGQLSHLPDPVLRWQVGHVHVKTDDRGNRRPCKPAVFEGNRRSGDDSKKIDAVVALVMALGRAQLLPLKPTRKRRVLTC